MGTAQLGKELLTADIRNLAAMVEAMAGVDAIIHLAGIPHEDSFERILAVNIIGTCPVFDAARRQQCPRVVFASSLRVTGFYPAGQRIGPARPVRPDGFWS